MPKRSKLQSAQRTEEDRMHRDVLDEKELIAEQAVEGIATDCSLPVMLEEATTIREVIWQLEYYSELLGELWANGWELVDRPEGTWLFLQNPKHPTPASKTP